MPELKKNGMSTQNVSVSPEIFRILTYVTILVIVLIGWFLTKYFSHIDFHNNPMINAFGYNNVCVVFDFPPSTYVLPMIYSVAIIFWFIYLYTHWLRARFLIVSNLKFAIFTFISLVELILGIIFSIIFAVSPMENLTIHYAGYTAIIFGFMLLALNNFVYFHVLMLNSLPIRILGISYLVSALIIGAIKLFLAVNFLLLGYPWLEPFGYSLLNKENMISIYLFVDRAWFLLFGVIPIFISFYLYKKLPHLVFKISLKSEKDNYSVDKLTS